jgi:Glycosyltransferase family 87
MSARRPPLWLAVAAVSCGWAAAYSIGRWIVLFIFGPVHEDVVMYYVAAETGLKHGWAAIYDQAIFQSVSTPFPAVAQIIDKHRPFASAPLVAWLFAPLSAVPEPVAFAVWTALSLGALVLAWHIAAPYTGLRKFTLLLLALGLWPVLLVFYFGQPTMFLIALVAATWWLCAHDRPVAAGAALALATCLKPQAVLLLAAALLVSGRYRAVAGWVAGCVVLGIATVVALGPTGLVGWWHAIREVQGLPVDTEFTLAHLLGAGPLTYVLWGLQGAMALAVARWRRGELEIVLAAGLLGTAATASYFHEADYSTLVLAAWFVLRSAPPLWHRLWLLTGVIPMQLMTFGPNNLPPIWDFAVHAAQPVWDAAWLGILVASCFTGRRALVASASSSSMTTGPVKTN